jgi:hypothetical protein
MYICSLTLKLKTQKHSGPLCSLCARGLPIGRQRLAPREASKTPNQDKDNHLSQRNIPPPVTTILSEHTIRKCNALTLKLKLHICQKEPSRPISISKIISPPPAHHHQAIYLELDSRGRVVCNITDDFRPEELLPESSTQHLSQEFCIKANFPTHHQRILKYILLMNRETLLPRMLVSLSIADTSIEKANAVKLKPKRSRWQAAVGFRTAIVCDTSKNKNLQSVSDSSNHTEDSEQSSLHLENTTTICTRPSLELISHGCMKLRTQAESICRTFTSSSPCINESSSSLQPSVTFSAVEFHTHELILGDNPSVSVGPPLAMSWKAVESKILDLEEYETSRPPRRERRDLIVPRSMRETWLRAEGYARSELTEVENEIKVIKKHRRTNARKGLWEKVRGVVSSNDTSAQDNDASIKRRRRSSYDLLIRPSLCRVLSRKGASTAS